MDLLFGYRYQPRYCDRRQNFGYPQYLYDDGPFLSSPSTFPTSHFGGLSWDTTPLSMFPCEARSSRPPFSRNPARKPANRRAQKYKEHLVQPDDEGSSTEDPAHVNTCENDVLAANVSKAREDKTFANHDVHVERNEGAENIKVDDQTVADVSESSMRSETADEEEPDSSYLEQPSSDAVEHSVEIRKRDNDSKSDTPFLEAHEDEWKNDQEQVQPLVEEPSEDDISLSEEEKMSMEVPNIVAEDSESVESDNDESGDSEELSYKDTQLQTISSLLEESSPYQSSIEEFEGGEKDKEYLVLSENLMTILLKLDLIDTKGDSDIRDARRNAVHSIQNSLISLDSKCSVQE